MAREENAPCAVRSEPGTIFIEGRVSSRLWPGLMNAYVRSAGPGPVSLDFSGVDALEVSGLNALVKLAVAARAHGGELIATGLSPALRDVFASSRIDEAIPPGYDSPGPESRGLPAGWPWARPIGKCSLSYVPEGAVNLNINGRRPAGPIQGFGHLWEKTFRVALPGIGRGPAEVAGVFRENFPSFQPSKNRFYPSPAGIVPGEVVIINANTPVGLICTGVRVLHADDLSFTIMALQGHPEAGWVSFTAFEDQGVVFARIHGFARASDPLYETAFVLMGSREQEGIWMHVLSSLARHLDVDSPVVMEKTCVGGDYQWGRAGNILYNAQIMTILHSFRKIAGL